MKSGSATTSFKNSYCRKLTFPEFRFFLFSLIGRCLSSAEESSSDSSA